MERSKVCGFRVSWELARVWTKPKCLLDLFDRYQLESKSLWGWNVAAEAGLGDLVYLLGRWGLWLGQACARTTFQRIGFL
jgi:hypothetical protein